jgi:hypothetical protein
VLQTFNKWFVIIGFEANRNYIAQNLCENRTKPKSCCHGKCFLKKQLTKDNDQQTSGKSRQNVNSQVFFDKNIIASILPPAISIQKNTTSYLCGKSQEYILSFFQPPQA